MLRLVEVLNPKSDSWRPPDMVVTLTFEQRRRSRLLVTLDDGGEAALLLPRGTILRDGDRLRGHDVPDGERGGGPGAEQGAQRATGIVCVEVRAAAETLSIAHTTDPLLLARAAYHLGNRHVPLQVRPGWLAYEHDHVLDDLVSALGLAVDSRIAPFEPEAGGYSHHGQRHEHAHEHAQAHDHEPGHAHEHPHAHGASDRHDRHS